MRTERLYFTDSQLLDFEANVVAVAPLPAVDGQECCQVVLDRTAFYPEGGGQPADHGELDGARVLDVQEQDGEIRHVVMGAFSAAPRSVRGKIDAIRRFDHMQQHSGQHLLSRVLIDLYRLPTSSFHLGIDACTIDLPTAQLSERQVEAAEERAAELIRAARSVNVLLGEAARSRTLRKEGNGDPELRVISIDGVDDCGCGGTHVATTAQIEAIAIRRVERINDQRCRVEFVCGGRARLDYRAKRQRLRTLAQLFSAEEVKLVDVARAAKDKQKELEKRLVELGKELLPMRADKLLASAEAIGAQRMLIARLPAEERASLQPLAQDLSRRGGIALALVAAPEEAGGKGQLVVAASPDSGVSAVECLRAALLAVGGAGGGSPVLAQGGFPGDRVEELVSLVSVEVRKRLDR